MEKNVRQSKNKKIFFSHKSNLSFFLKIFFKSYKNKKHSDIWQICAVTALSMLQKFSVLSAK